MQAVIQYSNVYLINPEEDTKLTELECNLIISNKKNEFYLFNDIYITQIKQKELYFYYDSERNIYYCSHCLITIGKFKVNNIPTFVWLDLECDDNWDFYHDISDWKLLDDNLNFKGSSLYKENNYNYKKKEIVSKVEKEYKNTNIYKNIYKVILKEMYCNYNVYLYKNKTFNIYYYSSNLEHLLKVLNINSNFENCKKF